MPSAAENHLPKVVDMIGDRIGLNYNIKRREATELYISQHDRLDLSNLKNSFYSLSERRTKKVSDSVKKTIQLVAKNPLKLNSKIRKKLYRLTPEEKQRLQYRDFEQVHTLWLSYAQKVLSNNDTSGVFRMDLHGCLIRCTASKNPTLIGEEGFIIQDTKNTFLLLKRSNRLITVPKRECVFEFQANGNRYRIQGCNFMFTTQARTKIKYKQKRNKSDV